MEGLWDSRLSDVPSGLNYAATLTGDGIFINLGSTCVWVYQYSYTCVSNVDRKSVALRQYGNAFTASSLCTFHVRKKVTQSNQAWRKAAITQRQDLHKRIERYSLVSWCRVPDDNGSWSTRGLTS